VSEHDGSRQRLNDEQHVDWLRLIRTENAGPRGIRAQMPGICALTPYPAWWWSKRPNVRARSSPRGLRTNSAARCSPCPARRSTRAPPADQAGCHPCCLRRRHDRGAYPDPRLAAAGNADVEDAGNPARRAAGCRRRAAQARDLAARPRAGADRRSRARGGCDTGGRYRSFYSSSNSPDAWSATAAGSSRYSRLGRISWARIVPFARPRAAPYRAGSSAK
jgi:hypothetical protein